MEISYRKFFSFVIIFTIFQLLTIKPSPAPVSIGQQRPQPSTVVDVTENRELLIKPLELNPLFREREPFTPQSCKSNEDCPRGTTCNSDKQCIKVHR